ncbi:hypothetical protein F7725_012464, partial [Dissostichus mawsoni]
MSFNLATAALQYTAAELLRLRFHLPDTSPALHLFLDIARHPRRKYIHRGSRRRFHIDDSKTIQSIWSSTRQLSRNPARKVDHTVLASLARSANVSAKHKHDHTDVNFGLFNILALTTSPAYNNNLHKLLNTLAPLKTRSVSFTHSGPWFTPENVSAKKLDWKEMYNNHILHYKDTLYSQIILLRSSHQLWQGNTRALFSTVKYILRPQDSLAPHQYSTAYCNSL